MSGLANMFRAAVGSLPLIPRNDRLPDRRIVVEELPIDRADVAAYAAVIAVSMKPGATALIVMPRS